MKNSSGTIKLIENVLTGLRSGGTVARMPALLILTGIINAVLPRLLFPDCAWWQLIICVVPLIAGAAFLLPRKQLLLLVLAIGAGFASLGLHRGFTAGSYVSLLGNRDRGAEIKAKVIDTACCGKALPWLPNPALMTVEVVEVRINGDEKWRKTYGKAAVRLPTDAPLLNYGDVISLSGTFRHSGNHYLFQENIVSAASGAVKAGEFQILPNPGSEHFSDYLKSRDISRIFYCRKFAGIENHDPGFYRPLLEMRNFLLKTVTEGIQDEKHRNLLATILFGCRQGLDYASKLNYIKSGTIHIFTVSGLHVGILAFLLFWFFRWMPFRRRHLLVPVLLLLYVLSTGMHPPALRAWLMITVWCICRASLLYIPALNIVFLTAAVLILKNPYYLKDMGFQFSFIVVAFLLFSSRNINEWATLTRELTDWIPPKYRGWRLYLSDKWRRKIFMALSGCIVAWFASSGICLYYQGIYFPFSIVANFLLIPFVLLLFNLIFLKIILSVFSFLLPLTAWLVESVTGLIDFTAGLSLDVFESTHAAAPTIYGLLVFYTFLLVLIVSHKRLTMLAGLLGTGGMIIFWHVSGSFTPPSLTIIHGGDSREPAFVIIEPAVKSAVVVNVPSFEAARCIAARLGKSGVRKVDRLVFTGSRKDFCDGAEVLAQRLEIRQVIQLVPRSRSRVYDDTVNTLFDEGAGFEIGKISPDDRELFEYYSGKLKIVGKNQRLRIEYQSSLLHIRITTLNLNSGRKIVKFSFDGHNPVRCELVNSSVLEMRDYVID